MLSFENPFYLFALAVVIALVIFIYFFSLKHLKKRAIKFANFDAIERVTGAEILSKNVTLFYIRIVIVILLVLSLSGIRFYYIGPASSLSYVLAIDSSVSMGATDIFPNRLEASKEAAIKFVDDTPVGTEIGLISFAGTSFIEEAITLDKEQVKRSIREIELKESGGTDMFGAIITSKNLLKAEEKNGAIILLTDGQFNVKTLEEVLVYLEGTPVYALGVGTETGGEYLGTVVSRLESETLKTIADYSGGAYYNVTSQEEIENAYSEIITLKRDRKTIDLSVWFLIIAIALVLVDWFLGSSKFRSLP
jgi:Ca-activated chloride channel family protein